MMPILHWPGVIKPGQFGPIKTESLARTFSYTRTISSTGTPSVIAAIILMPASSASRIASAANGGGTKIIVASAPVSLTASETVSKTGKPSAVCPPLPGVTPPTICVPYSLQPRVWKPPALPVIPWQMTRVWLSTRMLMGNVSRMECRCFERYGLADRGDDFFRRVGQVNGGDDIDIALGQHFAALFDFGAFQANHQRNIKANLFAGLDDGRRDRRAASDAAEDIHQNGFAIRVGQQDPESFGHLFGICATTDVQEVGRFATVILDDIHRAHRQSGTVDQAADVAIE